MNSVLKWELWGIAVIFLMGTILHFAFDWTGRFQPVGVIAAVNESVWEHLKLAFWPALFFAILEYRIFGAGFPAFITAKAIGIYAMPLIILLVHYGYRAVLGRHIVVVDILLFLAAVGMGQLISYRLMGLESILKRWRGLSLLSLLFFALCLGWFTFHPPRLFIFRDGQSGSYGIINHTEN